MKDRRYQQQKALILLRGAKLLEQLAPGIFAVTIVMAVLNALTPFITLYVSSLVIDELLGGRSAKRLLWLVLFTVFASLFITVIVHWLDKVKSVKQEKIYWGKNILMDTKTLTMDYDLLESPKTHLFRQKIRESENMNGGGLWQIMWSLDRSIAGCFSAVFSAAILFSLFSSRVAGTDLPPQQLEGVGRWIHAPIISVTLLLVIVAAAWYAASSNTKMVKKTFSWMDAFIPSNRRTFYYWETYLADYKAGKDIRIYHLQDSLHEDWAKDNHANSKIYHAIGRLLGKTDGVNSGISSFIGGLAYLYIALKAAAGAVSIGSIVRYAGSVIQLTNGLTEVFKSVSQLWGNIQYLQMYFDFLDLQNEGYHGTLPVEKRNDYEYEIEFHHVSFHYPESDEDIIQDLSIKFMIGERLAIVGMNGSGKTTMIKLLCRLYDPTEGFITLNGIDIRKYDYSEYVSLFSVVFQDFKLFSFELGQNVAAGMHYDGKKAAEALNKAGMGQRLREMPNGLGTTLYMDFDETGIEISGGEAQKIALARALYKNAPFVVLDEPTAALDPISEAEVYASFDRIVGDKTAIYISHRLSSCRFCDTILVFHKGRVTQKGTHDALLSDGHGKYHELWHAQAQHYGA